MYTYIHRPTIPNISTPSKIATPGKPPAESSTPRSSMFISTPSKRKDQPKAPDSEPDKAARKPVTKEPDVVVLARKLNLPYHGTQTQNQPSTPSRSSADPSGQKVSTPVRIQYQKHDKTDWAIAKRPVTPSASLPAGAIVIW